MMFRKVRYRILRILPPLLFFSVLTWGCALAAGMQVEPGQILIQNVPPGISDYDIFANTGIKLKVINLDTTTHAYSVSSVKPSEVSSGTWLKGYLEIPDASWFYFDKSEVTVGAGDTGYVKMYVKVPAGDQYCNQHWVVAIPVSVAKSKGPVEIGVALYPHFLIETESKAPAKEKPYGTPGFEPSTIILKDVVLGKAVQAKAVIYNNDKTNHTYRLKVFAPQLISETKRQAISPSPGYSWIPDSKWIKPNLVKYLGLLPALKDVKVGAGKGVSFPIEVLVPKNDSYYGQKWEVVIMAEPEKGQAGFVRLRIETQNK